jgi:hypothetical protein
MGYFPLRCPAWRGFDPAPGHHAAFAIVFESKCKIKELTLTAGYKRLVHCNHRICRVYHLVTRLIRSDGALDFRGR